MFGKIFMLAYFSLLFMGFTACCILDLIGYFSHWWLLLDVPCLFVASCLLAATIGILLTDLETTHA